MIGGQLDIALVQLGQQAAVELFKGERATVGEVKIALMLGIAVVAATGQAIVFIHAVDVERFKNIVALAAFDPAAHLTAAPFDKGIDGRLFNRLFRRILFRSLGRLFFRLLCRFFRILLYCRFLCRFFFRLFSRLFRRLLGFLCRFFFWLFSGLFRRLSMNW